MSKKKPAKKKAAKKTRAASATRRKTTKYRPSTGRPKTLAEASDTIQLKPIYVLIERAIADMQALPQNEGRDSTLRQLQTCALAFADICDPNTPGGCGPSMEFPRN